MLLLRDLRAAYRNSSYCMQLHLQFVLLTGVGIAESVLASSAWAKDSQTAYTLSGDTTGQALEEHVELPGYLAARAAGLISEAR